MEKQDANKTRTRKIRHKISAPLDPGFYGRFTCGNGPDEEPDGFQIVVRGFVRKGHSEAEAKKTAEACFKALAKL